MLDHVGTSLDAEPLMAWTKKGASDFRSALEDGVDCGDTNSFRVQFSPHQICQGHLDAVQKMLLLN